MQNRQRNTSGSSPGGRTLAALRPVWRSICAFYKKYELLLFAVALGIAAAVLRTRYLDFRSGDYNGFLYGWFEDIKKMPGLSGFASGTGDYTQMYKYIITLLTKLPMDSLYSYKLVSCLFDYLLALYAGLIVRHITKNRVAALLGYGAILFLPNVFLNSAVWGQCDAIFTAFTVMSFYYLLKERDVASLVCYGIAFAFKIQAVFFAPVIVLAFLRKKFRWFTLPVPFLTYGACALPAVFAGMNAGEALFGIYLRQIGEYSALTLNAPNLYQFLGSSYAADRQLSSLMVWCSFGLCALLCIAFYRYRGTLSDTRWVCVAYLFAVVLPFVLPHMHERYFYMADIFAVLFAFCCIRKTYVAVLTIYPSLRVVMCYLFDQGHTQMNVHALTVILLAGIALLVHYILCDFSGKKVCPESETPAAPQQESSCQIPETEKKR